MILYKTRYEASCRFIIRVYIVFTIDIWIILRAIRGYISKEYNIFHRVKKIKRERHSFYCSPAMKEDTEPPFCRECLRFA